ncbi:MAG TPA: L,D-transpeptidase family protein [Myxococcota bacterium]|nr:MAG: L,D-transpeptidase catalytic domain [Deltaproteobacteria bacterium ADurb.Bin058]HOE81473.1 L,D-transpeptidase family protein [Myxococcota bacterium]HOS60993.1 L,D-transpeptidase family protein [Myxococcota bacterium]HPL24137.1 L,D-transpeptidase family protein [Myxococcota bacterium]HRV18926.1 L,D-transpeptidase family protein [Myxococcota bacterium]
MRIISTIIFVVLVAFRVEANELVDIYRTSGVGAMEKRADELLGSVEYWKEAIKDLDTRFGYFEVPVKHLFLVDKSAYRLTFYDYKGGRLTHHGDHRVMLGDAHGDKFVAGDLKTPVGTYRITLRFDAKNKLGQFYGPLAYATNYPNHLDKSLKKTGHSIWIHGFPLNGDRSKDRSEGCVVLQNDVLSAMDKQIQHDNIVVMINEAGLLEADKEDLANVLSLLFKWRWFWKNADLKSYLELYSEDFVRSDGAKRDRFDAAKRQAFKRGKPKKVELSNIEVMPYPNSIGQTLFIVRFRQAYKLKAHVFKRTKELYIRKQNGRFSIVLEH